MRHPLLIALTLLAAPAGAQVITGTLLGTVTDPSGSAVPRAKVAITNSKTGVHTNVVTNEDGEYTAPLLQPGEYEVAIEAPGFKAFRQTAIELTLDSKYRVDAHLQLGSAAETIQVVADVVALKTDSSDLSVDVSREVIEYMPNIGKNPLAFVSGVAGIVGMAGYDDPDNIGIGDDSRRIASSLVVNGSRSLATEFLLDGAPNTGTAFNEIAILPNTDAIGQVKIITNAYSAEFGRVGGGVVSFGTKSGTNAFHGSLYEYWRNPVLNANSFGNNSFGRNPDGTPVRPKGKFNLNQFGGTVHGPIEIPHVYNGRNKTFFFFSYEGVRRVDDASAFYTVPTELERRGDFTQSRAQVRNPSTGALVVVPRSIFAPFPSTTTVTETRPQTFRVQRQQFVDGAILNKIPANRINPVAQKFVNLYPLPNITPVQPDGTQNYFDSDANRIRTDQIIVKLDHNASQQHRSFFRYTTDWTIQNPANLFRNSDPEAANSAPVTQFNPSVTLGHTWAQSIDSLFEFRANWTRINLVQLPTAGLNTDLAGLGFAGDMLQYSPSYAFPRITASGYPSIGLGSFVMRDNHNSNLAVSANWTRIRSKWTFKFGGEYRLLLSNFFQAQYPSMAFSVASFTRSCGGSDCPSLPFDRPEGHVLADFLIGNLDGLFGNGQFTLGDPRMALKNTYFGFFSQNDWKATRRLTINLGGRWDYQGPFTDRYDRLSQFDRTAKNITGTPGRFLFSGHNGVGRGQMDPDYRDWAPRVGLAYRIGEKTVVRSAYGISYDQITGIGSGSNGFGITGFQYPAFMRIRPENGLDILERTFNNAFNGGGSIIGANPDDPRFLGLNGVVAFDRKQRTPYVQQWNFTVERRLPWFHLTAAYVGTKGTRMIVQSFRVNEVNSVPLPVLDQFRGEYMRTGVNPASQLVNNPFYGIIPAGNPNVSGSLISLVNLNKAFPAYGLVRNEYQRLGSSSYNALQITGRRPFARGFELTGTYTWSKNIDFGNSIGGGAGVNDFTVRDWHLQRSVSANDVTHRATLNYVWELPFGRRKPLFARTPVLGQVLGGWKLGGLTTWSGGFPLNITGGTGFGRPDQIADAVLPPEYRAFGDGVTPHKLPDGSTVVVPNRRYLYFNPKAYLNRMLETKNPRGNGTSIVGDVYWYGTAPRYDSRLRGRGIDNFNMSLTRIFRVGEKVRGEVRADAYNVFNRTEFSVGSIDRSFGSANASLARGPLGVTTDANFGTLDVTARPGRTPRYMQLSMKLTF